MDRGAARPSALMNCEKIARDDVGSDVPNNNPAESD